MLAPRGNSREQINPLLIWQFYRFNVSTAGLLGYLHVNRCSFLPVRTEQVLNSGGSSRALVSTWTLVAF